MHLLVTTGVSLVGRMARLRWAVAHDAVNEEKRVIFYEPHRSDIQALEGHQLRPINRVLLQRYISDHKATRVRPVFLDNCSRHMPRADMRSSGTMG